MYHKYPFGSLTMALVAVLAMAAMPLRVGAETRSQPYFKLIDNRSGLPDNSINAIAQDDLGFIWLGTWNGLCRWDGHSATVYRHSETDSLSLPYDMVRALLPATGGMWIGHDRGLCFYSNADGTFHPAYEKGQDGQERKPITNRVSRLLRSGKYIFATTSAGELLRLSPGKDTYNNIVRPKGRQYGAICRHSDGRLIALDSDGISLLSADGSRVVAHTDASTRFTNYMNVYYSAQTSVIYAGYGVGTESRAFRLSEGDHLIQTNDWVPAQLTATYDYGSRVCFATDGDGLKTLYPDGSISHIIPENSSLPGDAIYSLLADSNGLLWVGTYRMGLGMYSDYFDVFHLIDRQQGDLSYNIVSAINMHGRELVVALDGGGIDKVNLHDRTRQTVNTRTSTLPSNNVVTSATLGDDLWMGVYMHGLCRMDLKSGKVIETVAIPEEIDPTGTVWKIATDPAGKLWIGARTLGVYDPATGRWETIEGTHEVSCMSLQVRGDNVWVGTRNGGIFQIDHKSRKVVRHLTDSPGSKPQLASKAVDLVYFDSRGLLWYNCPQQGFFTVNLTDNTITRRGLADGLTDQRATAIAEDSRGSLWIGTKNGLFNYLPLSESFVEAGNERLPSTYISGATFTRGDTVYMGTNRGLVYFDTRRVHSSRSYTSTIFTSLNVTTNNAEVMDLYTAKPSRVKLDYDQNFFTVGFTVPEMINPRQVHFVYTLEGLEEEWHELTSGRRVSYTNLPAGKYALKVRHSRPDGSWSVVSALPITIAEAWYASGLAKVLWILLAAGVLWLTMHLWMTREKVKHQLRIQSIEANSESELNEAKLNFYAQISHELRTPVFLISAQVEELLDPNKPVVQVRSSYLASIHRSAVKLNRLVNHIIDMRKIETGHLQLNYRDENLVKFLHGMTDDYQSLCAQKEIEFNFEAKRKEICFSFDPDKVEMAVSNLISNAFKYTKEGGKVTLTVDATETEAMISVKDNGIGIMDSFKEAIFSPFVRTPRGRSQSGGDGLGLEFVKKIVEQHDGRVAVESEVDKGSTFTITLPIVRTESRSPLPEAEAADAAAAEPLLSLDGSVMPVETPADVMITGNPASLFSILIVDDDAEILSLLGRYLAPDFRIHTAADGEEALAAVRQFRPDIVLTDLSMPRLDGQGLLTAIRADKEIAHTKVIIFSAQNSEENMIQAFDAGVDIFLTKPLSLKVLRKHIDLLLSKANDTDTSVAGEETKTAFNRQEQQFLLRCREIIDDNLRNNDFSIEYMADALAMSHSSLYKKIKRMTGMSLVDFINEYRIHRAVMLFRKGQTSVNQVAEECGFRDPKTFRDTFKRKIGMSPKQFMTKL